MEGPLQKVKITSSDTFRKKFFSSWIIPLITLGLLSFVEVSGFAFLFAIVVAFGLGLLYSQLQFLSYDVDSIYFGSKKVPFDQLLDISFFNINSMSYLVFKCKVDGKKKRYFVLLGTGSVFGLILAFFGLSKKVERTADFLKYAEYRIQERKQRQLEVIRSRRRR